MYNDIGDNMNEFTLPKEVEEQFYALETSLFFKEYLNDKKYLDDILHPDFMEIGKNGSVYHKKDTIEALYGSDDRKIDVKSFSVRMVSLSMFIVNYISTHEDGTRVYRTSLWMETLKGYSMYFHQGTIINENKERPKYFL